MYDLTQRQIEILKCIVKEYIDSAEPVGSETIEKKFDLGVSPATIRNEMAAMVKTGYLGKTHSSSGRIPTSKALKLYVNELMKERQMSVADEVEAKEKVWDIRQHEPQFLREMVRNLAQKTGTLSLAVTDKGELFYSGYAHILETPEFYDIDIAKNLLTILDNYAFLYQVMQRIESQCSIFLGDDFPEESFQPYGFVFSRFQTRHNRSGSIGIIGPARLRYEMVIPTVRYYGSLVGEIADW